MGGKRWTTKERRLLAMLYPNTSTTEIASLLARSEHSVEHQASLAGLHKSDEFLSQIRLPGPQKNYHCEPYLTYRRLYLESHLSIAAIAKQMGCSISKVQKYLEREGLTRNNLVAKQLMSQQTHYNSTFFDCIDSQTKAYWLGFFYADGYLDKNGSTVRLMLAEKDAEHLQRFAAIFQEKVVIRQRQPDSRTGNIYRSAICAISCAYLWRALQNKGIKQGNTLSEDVSIFTYIPETLMHHFVRGFFDGDGSISVSKEGRRLVSFVGSAAFLSQIRNIIVASVGLHLPKLELRGKLSVLRWNGNKSSQRIHDWLYCDACVYMERKFCVFK